MQTVKDHRLDTLGQIVAAHQGHWFDPETLRWFNSRVSAIVYPTFSTEGGTYFVSSERCATDVRRLFTVRRAFLVSGHGVEIETVGIFQDYKSRETAHRAAKILAAKNRFTEGV